MVHMEHAGSPGARDNRLFTLHSVAAGLKILGLFTRWLCARLQSETGAWIGRISDDQTQCSRFETDSRCQRGSAHSELFLELRVFLAQLFSQHLLQASVLFLECYEVFQLTALRCR